MNKKVIVRLQGGLGNQLHQYAYGLLLAKKNDAELYLDTDFLTHHSKKLNITLRDLEINKFKLQAKFYKSIFTNQFFFSALKRLKLNKIFELLGFSIVSSYVPLSELNNKKIKFYYLDGIMGLYDDYKDEVAYVLNNLEISNTFLELEKQVKSCISGNAVAMHIRRTDYLKKGSIHHVLGLEYYQNSINYIESKLTDPVFYIFSDDRNFVKDNFIGEKFKIIDYSGDNAAFFDFLAIKNCQHHIIANSTFSWWAAFLNMKKDNITICPSICLTTEDLNLLSTYPSKWLVF
ncbi:alpha-1,2-fucosyltransferase [Flavobacterium sp. SORGH_AS_0622]|uniref:alpha-1,2-fucosyltransferase n=1 Tax=Flavobacterium sp. SORGH_AS_0622 TaxID=3041772 RepID=UPI00278401BE|nr:alpha-1,2-fucosyltransferase [Flavobacterium sp. SORGH_AS_0622]MDQ1167514.1 hypothetical protein [Flavobacterium sp. SORGH_AS_0622]